MKLFSFEKIAFSLPQYKSLTRNALLIPEQYKCKYNYTTILPILYTLQLRNPCNEAVYGPPHHVYKILLLRVNIFIRIETIANLQETKGLIKNHAAYIV